VAARPDVGADRIERQGVDLGEDAGELRLEVGEPARHDRQLQRVAGPVELRLRRIREILERDVELAGEQAPGAQLRPQPLLLDDAAQDPQPRRRVQLHDLLAGGELLHARQESDDGREERD
jgi:hypothetical protein